MTSSTQHSNAEALNEVLSSERFHLTLIIFLAVTVIFSKLGGDGLANYDDAHYAQKAKEILGTGDWVTMHYNGHVTFEQPPLFLDFIALSFKAFGVGEYGAKFPSASFGVATIVLVYFFGRLLFDRWAGLFASLVLSTTQIFTRYAARAMQDVTLTFFVSLALFALLLGLRKDSRYFLLWGLSIAASILVKSVLGFFPALISLLFLLATKRWKALLDPWFIGGTLLILAVGCSWYVHQYLTYGADFLNVHFGWIILQRGFNAGAEPWYAHLSYGKDLLTYYWPWLPVFVFAVWKLGLKAWQGEEHARFVFIWAATVFLIMSAMQTRIVWYIMQMFPAAALMCGATLNEVLGEARRVKFTKLWLGLALLAAIAINATPLRLSKERERDIRVLAPYVRHFAERGCSVIAYRLEYYGYNNAMIFYSDRNVGPILQTPDELTERFRHPDTVLCLIGAGELQALSAANVQFVMTRNVEEFCLISNRVLDISGVKTW